jgi:hypothetical protein
MKKLWIVLLWIGCSYADYGLTLGYFTKHYPQDSHIGFAVGMATGGPLSLPAALSDTPLHWRTKPLTTEERWQAFHEQWPSLSRDYFEREYN